MKLQKPAYRGRKRQKDIPLPKTMTKGVKKAYAKLKALADGVYTRKDNEIGMGTPVVLENGNSLTIHAENLTPLVVIVDLFSKVGTKEYPVPPTRMEVAAAIGVSTVCTRTVLDKLRVLESLGILKQKNGMHYLAFEYR